jgi:hypothetical protein
MDILDSYVMKRPAHQNAVDIFSGEWSSKIPAPVESGHMPLFQDSRIKSIADAVGGFEGKMILELGPLEAAHTTMMNNMGAAHVTAIEANSRAYLKCLITKEILKLQNVEFLLGDFDIYLEEGHKFDFVLSCGVIYHCLNPIKTLVNLTRITDQIGFWSHYYIEEEVKRIYGDRFVYSPVEKEYEGYSGVAYEHRYKQALKTKSFCGGGNSSTFWMPMEVWTDLFDKLGFDFEVLSGSTDTNPHGPEFTAVAKRRV